MIEFNNKEIEFLKELEEARIATAHNDIPHVKPVSFVFADNSIVVATDYNTRTFNNIKLNSKVGIVIDIYKSGEHRAICIQGDVKIIEAGSDFKILYDIFYEKFAWVKKDPWKENEAPFLKIIAKNKVSWGLS